MSQNQNVDSPWSSAIEILRVKPTAGIGIVPGLSSEDPTKVYLGNKSESYWNNDARTSLFHQNKPTNLPTYHISKRIGKEIEWKQEIYQHFMLEDHTERSTSALRVSALTLDDLVLAKCVTTLMLFKCGVFCV